MFVGLSLIDVWVVWWEGESEGLVKHNKKSDVA